MMPAPLAKLMDIYYKGSLTPMQIGMELIEVAAKYPPEHYASLIPTEVLEAIREIVESPPATLEETAMVFRIRTVVRPCDWVASDYEEERLKERQQWFDGIWLWHRLLQTDWAKK
jgi:hypothetical protein